MRNVKIMAMAAVLLVSASLASAADPDGLDPLLRLLVTKGVITLDEALALQDEAARTAETPVKPAAPAPPAKWYDRLKVSGDVRMRYEGFSQQGAFDDGRRDRFRFRLRAGLEAPLTDALTASFQLRNGDRDDPVSNNTTFEGAFQPKEFNLGEVYLEARLSPAVALIGGKFDPKDWWTVSDFQWDDDVTVEGLMARLEFGGGDGAWRGIKLVPYTYLLEESGAGREAYVFGLQARADLAVGAHGALGLGAGFDLWDNPQAVADLTLTRALGGNPVTNLLDASGRLVSDFEILNLFAEWRHRASKRWPITVNLFYYQNLGARGVAADEDTAYFARLQAGDSREPGQLALRYSYYDAEPDALFYVFTQSDTSRASDVEAHRFDLRVGFIARSYFNLTWYHTRSSLAEGESLDRWQVDYNVRF